MFPIILQEKDENKVESYIAQYLKKEDISKLYKDEIVPEKNTIKINQIREIKNKLKYKISQKHLIVVYNFDNATNEAQNAFLKTLEEHNKHVHFIIQVSNIHQLLPTILSRSKIVNLSTNRLKHILEPGNNVEEIISNILEDKDYSFLGKKEIINCTKETAKDLLDSIILYFHKNLKKETFKSAKIIKETIKTNALLNKNNLNPQLSIDLTLLFIKKIYHN